MLRQTLCSPNAPMATFFWSTDFRSCPFQTFNPIAARIAQPIVSNPHPWRGSHPYSRPGTSFGVICPSSALTVTTGVHNIAFYLARDLFWPQFALLTSFLEPFCLSSSVPRCYSHQYCLQHIQPSCYMLSLLVSQGRACWQFTQNRDQECVNPGN